MAANTETYKSQRKSQENQLRVFQNNGQILELHFVEVHLKIYVSKQLKPVSQHTFFLFKKCINVIAALTIILLIPVQLIKFKYLGGKKMAQIKYV